MITRMDKLCDRFSIMRKEHPPCYLQIRTTSFVGLSLFTGSDLRKTLEATHQDSFVAIEPDSGDYFLATHVERSFGGAAEGFS